MRRTRNQASVRGGPSDREARLLALPDVLLLLCLDYLSQHEL